MMLMEWWRAERALTVWGLGVSLHNGVGQCILNTLNWARHRKKVLAPELELFKGHPLLPKHRLSCHKKVVFPRKCTLAKIVLRNLKYEKILNFKLLHNFFLLQSSMFTSFCRRIFFSSIFYHSKISGIDSQGLEQTIKKQRIEKPKILQRRFLCKKSKRSF